MSYELLSTLLRESRSFFVSILFVGFCSFSSQLRLLPVCFSFIFTCWNRPTL